MDINEDKLCGKEMWRKNEKQKKYARHLKVIQVHNKIKNLAEKYIEKMLHAELKMNKESKK